VDCQKEKRLVVRDVWCMYFRSASLHFWYSELLDHSLIQLILL